MSLIARKARPLTNQALIEARATFPVREPGARNIAVFCAATTPTDPEYARAAAELGALIGERGHNLVWGATDAGVMRVIATHAKARRAKLLGVNFAGAKDGGRASRADILFGATSISERKTAMLALADIAIAMPGGIGTIDEIATVLERKKSVDTMPPMVLLNTKGFYDGLVTQLGAMEEQDLLFDPVSDLVQVANTPQEAIVLAETLQPVDHSARLVELLANLYRQGDDTPKG